MDYSVGEITYFADVTTMQSHVTIQCCNVLEATITDVTFHRLRFTTHRQHITLLHQVITVTACATSECGRSDFNGLLFYSNFPSSSWLLAPNVRSLVCWIFYKLIDLPVTQQRVAKNNKYN